MNRKIIEHLKQFASEQRVEIFEKIIKQRTEYLTVVIEDVFQSHNASAVLRSSELFGVQQINIIENKNQYTINPDVAMGAFKWLTINRFNEPEINNTKTAIEKLKSENYRIVATMPNAEASNLSDFDISKGKFALLFGTELNGLSEFAVENSDEFIKIPMYGFTESFNISVSAAIILYELTEKMRKSEINWQLTPEKNDEILLDWLKKSVKNSDIIIKNFLKTLE